MLASTSPRSRQSGKENWESVTVPCASTTATHRDQKGKTLSNGEQLASPDAYRLPPIAGAPVLQHDAYHGLAGDLVRAFDPLTEAHPAAVLGTFLVSFGNAAGGGAHTYVGETRHSTNLAAVICGATSRSRKGTSAAPIERIFRGADEEWLTKRGGSGIGSGEGIIWAVRDASKPRIDQTSGRETVDDDGVRDKRFMVQEEEFSAFLKVVSRDGSIAGEVFRKAWDSGATLRNMVKRYPVTASNTHISILGHITLAELKTTLSETDQANGVGNRVLWIFAQRSKLLPDADPLEQRYVDELIRKTREALVFAKTEREINRDAPAALTWRAIYAELSQDYPGLFGALTARAEAQVLRLSLIYAALDSSPLVREPHLFAALAFWEYCQESVRFIFGDRSGDWVLDRIRDTLRSGDMSETDLRDLFGRHQSTKRIQTALAELADAGFAAMTLRPTGGRPARIWRSLEVN